MITDFEDAEPVVIGVCGKRGSGKDYLSDVLCERLGHYKLAFAYHLKAFSAAFVPGLDPFTDEAKHVRLSEFFVKPGGQYNSLTHYLSSTEAARDIAFVLKITPEQLATLVLRNLEQIGCRVDARFIVFPSGWTFGFLLQIMGTNVFRNNSDSEIWIKMVRYRMDKIMWGKEPFVPMTNKFVISDVRFMNEADFVRGLGGIVFRIKTMAEVRGQDNSSVIGDGRDSRHPSEVELERILPDMVVANEMNMECLMPAVAFAESRFADRL